MWIVIVLLAVLCLVLGGWLVALNREIDRISVQVDTLVTTDTNAELYVLARNRRLRTLAVRINALLDAQRRREGQVRQADAAFKASITGISHDLRTPLTSISGYLQMLRSGKAPPEKREAYFDIIERRLQGLLALLDELFAFAHLQSGPDINPERINLGAALTDQIALYYDAFVERGITPGITLPEQTLSVFCDRRQLERILGNLIKNVLTHGQNSLSIVLKADVDMAGITFANPAGGKEIDPDRLFDRFYTADRSRSGQSTGLGLAIVRQLAEDMGGHVEARLEDGLLSLTIRLPLAS